MNTRNLLAALAMLATTAASAQVVSSKWTERRWFSGEDLIAAEPLDNKKILMSGAGFFDAGYGWLFEVKETGYGNYDLKSLPANSVKLPEEKYGYMGINEPDDNKWQRQMYEGVDVVVVKNEKGEIMRVYAPLDPNQTMESRLTNNMMDILCGSFYEGGRTYTSANGKTYRFNADGTCNFGGAQMTFEIGAEEVMPSNIFVLSNKKAYYYEQSVEGIKLYNADWNKDIESYEKGAFFMDLKVNMSERRWKFMSISAIDNSFTHAAPEVLRLMRNEIYASKGYVFSDAKLDKYFRSCSWYKPGTDNSKVKLSPLESLNVALLKYAETHQ